MTHQLNQSSENCSFLYSLAPTGLGSGWVEGLTSYLARLAQEHRVYTGVFLSSIFLPRFAKPYLQQQASLGGSFWKKTVALNGTGTWARDFAALAEELTKRSNLRCLTMLNWADVLSPRGLLRRGRAWCPLCLAAWHAKGKKVYEPLVWSLDVITHCPLHRYPLQTQCPYADCARTQSVLTPRMRPGYCSTCLRWLGVAHTEQKSHAGTHADMDTEHNQQPKLWTYVEQMLVCSTGTERPYEREKLVSALNYFKDSYFHKDTIDFARYLGISRRSMEDILANNQTPQLSTLLRICDKLRMTPIELVNYGVSTRSGSKASQALVELTGTIAKTWPPRKHKKSPRIFDGGTILGQLNDILEVSSEPPPSMRQVAQQLGYDASHLHKHFPQRCSTISARYKAYIAKRKQERISSVRQEIRRVTLGIGKVGEYPSYRRVRAALSKSRLMHEPDAIATWHDALKDGGWEV